MDLNYLYCRQQIELMRAADASCPEARQAHQGLADGYNRLIVERRDLFSPTSLRR
ncbi:hypothetical protein IC614_02335 [Allosphingosinicella flava]|uniref:Uncharacterized protein n=1 Tax=Allosphingosinicella flava TaxID=2771430 RepID=A0A7T2GKD4_9SPHN|nr:hypothetical protein [Sphingosinicella flava]QPQ55468.1 hypothetical protein IC614_02335 [Sphingosinicella flava]